MAAHSGIPASKIPWTEEPAGYSQWGCKYFFKAYKNIINSIFLISGYFRTIQFVYIYL